MLSKFFNKTPLFVYLIAVFPAIQIYGVSAHRLTLSHVALSGAIMLGGIVAIKLASDLLLGNKVRVAIVLALIFVWLFFGSLSSTLAINVYAWTAIFAVLITVAVWIRNVPEVTTLLLNVVVLSLLITPAGRLAFSNIWSERRAIEANADKRFTPLKPPATVPETAKRDYYYIIMDRYARADQLARVYGFDNKPFLNELRKRGFVVSATSYSNYQRTAHSLTSSLNMDYLDGFHLKSPNKSYDFVPLYKRLRNARLLNFMKDAGFEISVYGSWWEPTRTNPLADINYNYRAWPELLRVVFENSLIGKAAQATNFEHLSSLYLQCRRPREKFARMKQRAGKGNRKFVFAHFLTPHPPFVVDENGKCLTTAEVQKRTRAQNYIGQLKYANKLLLDFIDHVQSQPGPKPVIVLQADEGPWPEKYARDEIFFLGADTSYVDWTKSTPADLREKMGILNAQYLPDVKTPNVPDNAAPVNTFRRILRLYFAQVLPDLPIRQYIFESGTNLYTFHDVTEKLKGSSD